MESDTDGFFAGIAKLKEQDKHRVWAEFFMHPLKNQARSAAEGRECFDDTEYVRIVVPMDRTSEVVQPATDRERQRFPQEYELFRKKQDQGDGTAGGTPLKEWSLVTKSQVEELRFLGVRSVEQLANVGDAHISKYMGLAGLREKARKWLATAKDVSAVVSKHDAEMTAMKAQLEAYERQVKELGAKLDQLTQSKR